MKKAQATWGYIIGGAIAVLLIIMLVVVIGGNLFEGKKNIETTKSSALDQVGGSRVLNKVYNEYRSCISDNKGELDKDKDKVPFACDRCIGGIDIEYKGGTWDNFKVKDEDGDGIPDDCDNDKSKNKIIGYQLSDVEKELINACGKNLFKITKQKIEKTKPFVGMFRCCTKINQADCK